ncbi:MAG: ABC transporter permease [Saprospiraceae bacterium]
MQKLWLIIQREYLTRVKKRTFILATILTPLGIGLLIFISAYLTSYDGDQQRTFTIVDEGHYLKDSLPKKQGFTFNFSQKTLQEEMAAYDSKVISGIVFLPKDLQWNNPKIDLQIYTDEKMTFDVRNSVSRQIEKRLRDYKMLQLGIQEKELAALETDVSIDTEPIKEKDKDESSLGAGVTAILGGLMGFVMYLTLFIYGMMVMRSVMEEKTNRIVEVMISSVKPFELMMGKILGVAAVGFTQLLIWILLTVGIGTLASVFFGFDPAAAQHLNADPNMAAASQNVDFHNIMAEVSKINWWLILPLFVFYFVTGYILYASLFAAVGSAIGDDTGEAQSLTMPITIPIILAIYIMFHAIRQPDSSLSVFASIFPLFSPIVMPARLGFNPPAWQIIASMALLILTVLAFVWLAGRIYRVGILMYGKKLTFKEMVKWMFVKN